MLEKAQSVLKEVNEYAKKAPILIIIRIRSLQHIKRDFLKRMLEVLLIFSIDKA